MPVACRNPISHRLGAVARTVSFSGRMERSVQISAKVGVAAGWFFACALGCDTTDVIAIARGGAVAVTPTASDAAAAAAPPEADSATSPQTDSASEPEHQGGGVGPAPAPTGQLDGSVAEPPPLGGICLEPWSDAEGVVALYTFDSDEGRVRIADQVAGFDGRVSGMARTVDGPAGCDRALRFEAGQFLAINDSDRWELDVGSIDLWLWLPVELKGNIGVLSRDERVREEPGHLSLFVGADGRAQLLMQAKNRTDDHSADVVSCSAAPLPREEWVHLGMNFGPPQVELFVDGILADAQGAHTISDAWSCGQPGDFGIAGNNLPWVAGASAIESNDELEDLVYPATGCAIDHLRFSSVRRNFAQPE